MIAASAAASGMSQLIKDTIMITWIKQWAKRFFRPVDWQFERYMAGATDRADLEYRMQAWARRGLRA